jgi:hypothetical protein
VSKLLELVDGDGLTIHGGQDLIDELGAHGSRENCKGSHEKPPNPAVARKA